VELEKKNLMHAQCLGAANDIRMSMVSNITPKTDIEEMESKLFFVVVFVFFLM